MKKLTLYTLIAAVLMTTVSCKKWMELEPQDGIIKEEFWKTKEQVGAAVIGIYSSMQEPAIGTYNTAGYIPALTELLFVWGEARADNIAPATFSSNDDLELV